MKRILLLFAAFIPMLVHAFEKDGIYYKITSSTELTVDVTYKGSGYYSNVYEGDIVIPDSVAYGTATYRVTGIGKEAFRRCPSINSVIIPNSVLKIGTGAFQDCTGLKAIIVPNSVVSIGDDSFSGCSSLLSATIGDKVTTIGQWAFKGCTNLSSLTIGNSVSVIGTSAFLHCEELTSVKIPNSVRRIGDGAFSGCTSLSSIDISYGVTQIEGSAFSNCTDLRTLTIPSSVTSIKGSIISGCRLNELIYNAKNASLSNHPFNELIDHVIVGDEVEVVPANFVDNMYRLTIGKNVREINRNAFSTCTDLKELTYNAQNAIISGTGVPGLGCNIKKVTLGDEVEVIPADFLCKCTGLKNISVPNSVKRIGKSAFSGCTSLSSLMIDGGVETIEEYAFWGCTSLTNADLGNNVKEILGGAFYGCNNLNSLDFGENLIFIGNNAFRDCAKLTSLNLGEKVIAIGAGAFQGCKSLTSVVIPNSVTNIGGSAFEGCSSLVSVNIPNSVSSIEGYVFSGCTGLTSVNIPKSVASVEERAFGNCTSLKDMYVHWDTPLPIKVSGMSSVFYQVSLSKATLHVPIGTKEAYRTASVWNDFGFFDEMPIPTYKLIYKVDGEIYDESEVEEGALITPLAVPTKEGYTFSGWSEIPATMPDHDVVVNGSFLVNKYLLTYKVDGNIYKQDSVAYGTPIVLIENPEQEGKTFSGWKGAPETMPAYDVTIVGGFVVNIYTLTYKVDVDIYKKVQYAYGDTITVEAAPTKEGYTFSGWSEIPATMPAHDVEVTGSFSVNYYLLTYFVDGEVYKTDSIAYGTEIIPEEEPTKEGYAFSGWSEIPATMPAHDVEVTGSFSVNSYLLTYFVDGEVYKTDSIAFGTEIVPMVEPTKEGYTFSGWSEIPATMPAYDVEVTGSFSVNYYLLTYFVDGEVYKTDSVAFGTEIVPEAELSKEGYTFSGWSEIPVTMPAHDVEVEGSFSVNYYLLTYFVDGEVYKTDSIAYGTEIVPETEPTKEGYTFSGWSEIPVTMPAHDVEVNGSFAINAYLLTYIVDGEIYKTDSIIYGSEIVPLEDLTKEGHTFSGWSEIPTTMPAHDLEVTGSFSVNYYKLTYFVDGEVYKTDSVAYGTEIVPETEPTKEGYTFSVWSEIPATMPAHDVEVAGSFSVNYYLLTYLVDGEAYKTDSIAFGTEIVPEAEPTKEGYTFSGWSEIPAVMPAHDVEVTGSFSANTYYIIYKVEGEEYFVDSVKYGEQIVPVEEPEREGHTFSGWQGLPEDLRMPAHDVEVTGTFAVNYYLLTYLVDGEVYQQDSVAFGTEIVLMPNPEKPGYIFSGWSGYPEDLMMPAADVTIVGSFEVDGIQRVAAGAGTDTMYDVLGRKAQTQRKGEIYLQNGKKIMIR